MKKVMRALRLTVAVSVCLFVFAMIWTERVSPAAAESHLAAAPPQTKRNVVAVVPRLWPPQYSTDENGKPAGFAIDVMEAVAAWAGLAVTYKVVDNFPKAVSILKSGGADIIPNIGIVAKRLDTIAFTAPVETFVVSLFVRDDTHDLSGEDALVGRKLAVVNANIGLFMFGKRKDIDVQVYPDVRTALFELVAGHVDGLVYPQSVLLALAREIGIEDRIKVAGKPLKEIKRGISVRKGNVALLAILDKAVESYVGTPAYQQVYAKWYGRPKPYWTTPRILWFMAGFIVITVIVTMGWHYFSVVRLNRALKKSEDRFRTMAAAAKASEARLKAILEIAPEAVIAIGKKMNIRLFNQGAERIFGYKADEVLGRPLNILMPERYRKAHGNHVKTFHGSGETYRLMDQRQEISGLRKDGTEFPATASVSKLEIAGETIFTVLLHDISDRKRAENAIVSSKEEAEIANYTKTQFLANMSHELRTPLNSIIGFSQVLMGDGMGKLNFSQTREYATNINDSANHLLALLQDILDVSKIEARELDLDKEPVDFETLIVDCFMMMRERADKGGVKLSYIIADDAPSINADEVRLKQVLLNLLSNAIKFTPEGGETTVSVEANGANGVCLKVDDTGIGIKKNDIPKVLRPFGQVRDIFTRNHEGTGLGLSLAKSLVELHDGNLEITSRVGKGTTVIVKLPDGHA